MLEQKIRSLDSVESWWFERLIDGAATRNSTEWLRVIPKALLVDDYIAASDRLGIKRKAAETEVGMTLGKLIPGMETRRLPWEDSPSVTTRKWCWLLPSLEDCRTAFEEALQQPVDWPEIESRETPDFEG